MGGRLQEEETLIDQEIVNELIELAPESWRSIILEVTCEQSGENVGSYDHVVWSPEGHKDIVTSSDKIFDATYRLGMLFEQFGRHWRKVTYRVHCQEDGSWKYKVNFEY